MISRDCSQGSCPHKKMLDIHIVIQHANTVNEIHGVRIFSNIISVFVDRFVSHNPTKHDFLMNFYSWQKKEKRLYILTTNALL